MTIVEKAAYLKGLCEGLGVDPASREGKLWGALNELLSDMAHEIEDLQSSGMDYADTLDEIGEELSYLEELCCGLERPEDMDGYCSGDCDSCEQDCPFPDDEEEDEFDDGEDEEDFPDDEDEDEEIPFDGVLYDVKCPVCGEEITFDEDTLEEGSIVCPKCGETLEFDLSGEEEE